MTPPPLFLSPRLEGVPSHDAVCWWAWPQAVLDVALEDHPVGLGESKGLIVGDQGVAIRNEPVWKLNLVWFWDILTFTYFADWHKSWTHYKERSWKWHLSCVLGASPLFWSPFCFHLPGEYWSVYGASILIYYGKSWPGVLGHGHATPGEYSVGRLVRDIDPESQLVTNPHSIHLLTPWVQDRYPWGRGLRSWCDTQVWSLTQFFSVGFLQNQWKVSYLQTCY